MMELCGKEYQTVTIIEPHSDDAFIGMGGILMDQDPQSVNIVTLSKGPVNDAMESAKIPQFFSGISHYDFGYLDARLKKDEIAKVRSVIGEVGTWEQYFQYYNPGISLKDVAIRICHECPADIYVFPVGLHHPMHQITWELADHFRNKLFYLDFPYCNLKRRIPQEIVQKTAQYKKFEYPVKDLVKKKLIFGKIYDTQWFITVQIPQHTVEVLYGWD